MLTGASRIWGRLIASGTGWSDMATAQWTEARKVLLGRGNDLVEWHSTVLYIPSLCVIMRKGPAALARDQSKFWWFGPCCCCCRLAFENGLAFHM